MHFLPLLGKHLKDDDMLEFLEEHEVVVVYDFDRTHENIPDQYWAASKKDGFQFRFSADQKLDVIFLYIAPVRGFSAIDCAHLDVPMFTSVAEIEAHCATKRLRFLKGQMRDSVLGDSDWARIDVDTHSVHFDFRGGKLTILTVSLPQQR